VTVVIGVVTVTVVPTDAVTVVVAIGVATVTVAATVTGSVGTVSVGNETPDVRGVGGDCAGAVAPAAEEGIAAGPASPRVPRVDSGASLTLAPAGVANRRRVGAPPDVSREGIRPGSAA
jgi:hypothetical protein